MNGKNLNVKEINKVKDFWNNRPCNIRHSDKEVGTLEYFEEVDKRRFFVESHILKFAEFEKYYNRKVLEIGCGIGTDTVRFAKNDAYITATDISVKSLEIAEKRFEVYGLKGNFYLGNAEELSSFLPIKSYDLIYSFGVIHHTPNPEKVIEEIKKYCRRGTEVKVMLYAKYSFKAIWASIKYGKCKFWKMSETIQKYSEAQVGSPVTYRYSKREIKNLFKDFDLLKIQKRFIFPYRIEEYKKLEYKKVWYFRFMPKVLFDILQRLLGWNLLITAKY